MLHRKEVPAMYERIMVPLDGSNAAEMVLPYAEEIAAKFNSELALVSVAEPTPAESDHPFRAYLKTIQEKVRAELIDWGARPGTRVDTEVLVRKPADGILTYAADKNVRLVVMASRVCPRVGTPPAPLTFGMCRGEQGPAAWRDP